MLLHSFEPLLLRRAFSISLSHRFRVLIQTVYWTFVLLSVSTKIDMWWNRGEPPRINETAAKVPGKNHDNWNSWFLSVHSSKCLAQRLAGSFQHCLWWLCITCLQGLTAMPWSHLKAQPHPQGGQCRGCPSCCSMRCLPGLSPKGHRFL